MRSEIERTLTWPGGATWVFRVTITNDGANSGTHEVDITPGARNDMWLLYGSIRNGDASTRTAQIVIEDDSANILASLIPGFANGVALTANDSFPWPTNDETGASAANVIHQPLMLAGAMNLHNQLTSVAVSQDSSVSVVARIRGALPTITITSPTGATETVDTNRIF